MSFAVGTTTAAQLASMPDDGKRYELVNGELRMMSPAGGEHGRVAMRIGQLLANHVRDHELGVVYAAETGFLITRDPDTVRAPDVAYLEHSRLSQITDSTGYIPLAPDVAVEVVSPKDSFSDVEEKAFGWLAAGTVMVLVVNPRTRTVHMYRERGHVEVLAKDDMLDAADVVTGWRVLVGELFS